MTAEDKVEFEVGHRYPIVGIEVEDNELVNVEQAVYRNKRTREGYDHMNIVDADSEFFKLRSHRLVNIATQLQQAWASIKFHCSYV
jgi:hypothetical protein